MQPVKPFDIDAVRAHFPALARHHDGRPVAHLDGAAGTQVPRECIDAIARYLGTGDANTGGAFPASVATDALLHEAHAAAADFLGAAGPEEVTFGPNMTTLTFAVSRAIGRTLAPGDEVVVSRLDHDADVAPWLALADEHELTVRWIDFRPDDCTLDLETLEQALTPRTKVAAVTLASNAVGTITPMPRIAELVHAVGAWLWVDAVHAAPHVPIDVATMGADFVVCSPYKFYGPHLGLLWARRELLASLPALKVRPASDELPGRWETGTQPHEALAGLLGTFEYLEWFGTTFGDVSAATDANGRRVRLRAAMEASRAYEQTLIPDLIGGLCSVPGLQIRGIVDPTRFAERCPTVSFTLARHHPREIAEALAARGINAWDGDYYAYEVIKRLGLDASGGMVRVGLVHYNTREEVGRLVDALQEISAG